MGMLDNIKKIFQKSNKEEPEVRREDPRAKAALAAQVADTINRIKKVNSFDSSIWNLSNMSAYDLQRKSVAELQSLQASLNNRLSQIKRQNERPNQAKEDLEASKWTGQRPQNMSAHAFDRFQRGDDRY